MSTIDPGTEHNPADSRAQRRWFIVGAILSVVVGLAVTAHPVFSPRMLEHYSDSPDSVDITRFAEQAATRPYGANLARWFTGSWIQESSRYYRPFSSIVLYAEYSLFGWNFQGHVIISWLVHSLICYLVYLLTFSLLTADRKTRAAFAAWAVVLFNLRIGPQGPGWLPAPVSYGVVAWWPAQTDQFSLLFALLALLSFDAWLRGDHPSGLPKAIALWVVSLLFKEMGVSLPLVAACLIVYRKGLASARPWVTAAGAGSGLRGIRPGLVWSIVFPGLAFSSAFLLMRSQFVAEAWGPESRSFRYFITKAMWYGFERPHAIVSGRGMWVVVIGLFIAACLYLYARMPRRPSAVWPVLSIIVGSGLIAQVMTGNFAIITIPVEIGAIGTLTLLALGCIVLLHVRSGPTWPLVGMVVAIHVPILHAQGPHYFYWPAALWAALNANLLLQVWQAHVSGTLQWSRATAPEAVSQPPQNETDRPV